MKRKLLGDIHKEDSSGLKQFSCILYFLSVMRPDAGLQLPRIIMGSEASSAAKVKGIRP